MSRRHGPGVGAICQDQDGFLWLILLVHGCRWSLVLGTHRDRQELTRSVEEDVRFDLPPRSKVFSPVGIAVEHRRRREEQYGGVG